MASKAGSDFNDLPADGVLGLSLFASGEDSSNEKPFLQQLVESGALFGPGYMVYLAADPKAELTDVVTYGDLDGENCENQVSYTALNIR
ncbi:hypothetical protein AAVH_08727 [Aphelenchoides avenae]|nr:hypothetical protein AAVH_08727 [Aphelenchus avenae]